MGLPVRLFTKLMRWRLAYNSSNGTTTIVSQQEPKTLMFQLLAVSLSFSSSKFHIVFHISKFKEYCSLVREMPEPLLTTDLSMRFEEAASQPTVTQQESELLTLIPQLPSYNQTLLAWTIKHFDSVLQHEKINKMNAQSLAMLLSPALQMSHRLLACILCHCSSLFEDTVLHK